MDFWGIYFIGNNGKENLRRRFGYTLLAISTLIIGNEISVVSDISDDKCTHTPLPEGIPKANS
jgi:hypothetical protein